MYHDNNIENINYIKYEINNLKTKLFYLNYFCFIK